MAELAVVPVHKGEDLGRGIVRQIAKDAQIRKEELARILEEI